VVNVTASFISSSVTVSNNATYYTFNGSGNIVSPFFLKQGTGKITIDNIVDNAFLITTISNGTVQVGNGDGNGNLGSSSVTNYGTLIFNKTNSA